MKELKKETVKITITLEGVHAEAYLKVLKILRKAKVASVQDINRKIFNKGMIDAVKMIIMCKEMSG